MSAQSYLYAMPAGVPGDFNRNYAGGTITPEVPSPLAPIPAFGVPVVYSAAHNAMVPVGAGNVEADIVGVIVRPYPEQPATAPNFGGAIGLTDPALPPTVGTISVLRRGFVAVQVNSGSAASAAKEGQVYVWIAASAAGHVQGGFEGAASGGNTILAPAKFRGACDPNGITELEWNL